MAFCVQTLVLPGLPPARWWALRVPFGIRLVLAAALGWLVAWPIGRRAEEALDDLDTYLGP